MPGFNPEDFKSKIEEYIKIADGELIKTYEDELDVLKGLSSEQIKQFGGSTSQMDEIIKEVEKAKNGNLKQAALIDNIKTLGQSTYDLAKNLSKIIS